MIKILVADPDPLVRQTLTQVLSSSDRAVICAASEAEFRAAVAGAEMLLAFVHHSWFGADVATTLADLRRCSPAIQTIAIAEQSQVSAVTAQLHAGVYDCLLKPFPEAELIRCMAMRAEYCARVMRERTQLATLLAYRNRELERLNSTIGTAASHDALTGLANHRIAQDALLRESDAALPAQRALSVTLLNVDNFRGYNTQNGHTSGDALLRAMAGELRALARPGDTIARWAGDEFLWIMPRVDIATAVTLARALCARIEALPAVSTVQSPERPATTATVSLGVATLGEHAASAVALISQLESAVIDAKRRGRNRVEVASGYAAGSGVADSGISAVFSGLHKALEA